jgi:hypothetical protein
VALQESVQVAVWRPPFGPELVDVVTEIKLIAQPYHDAFVENFGVSQLVFVHFLEVEIDGPHAPIPRGAERSRNHRRLSSLARPSQEHECLVTLDRSIQLNIAWPLDVPRIAWGERSTPTPILARRSRSKFTSA